MASIGCKATETSFVLGYRIQHNGGDWEPIKQPIPIAHIDCHYGNQRPYFRCPGVMNGRHCGRRAGRLFLGGKYFLCRHCYKIAYTSQSEAHYDRALRRANKTRMALGGEPGTAHWIAPKPKGMWQRTYQKKCWEIEHYEYQADLRFLSKFAHLLDKLEREMFFGTD